MEYEVSESFDFNVEPEYIRWNDTGKKIDDDAAICLITGMVKQAASDYRYALNYLAKNTDKQTTRMYKNVEKLRQDVINFTHSYLFGLIFDGVLTSKQFLLMAVRGQI